MLDKNQDTKRLNTQEVVLPPEANQEGAITIMPMSPMDYPVERFSQALERRDLNRQALLKWIQTNLKTGIDFGQIHVVGKDKCLLAKEGKAYECMNPRHWSKPSLWKPGAEKICGMLGLIPRFPNLNEYENAVLRGEDLKVIILKCELRTGSSFVAAEGTGARRVAQDNGDINKSLKMAEKSAHIDATLRVAGLSELFTQDLEDMVGRQEIQAEGGNQDQPPAQPVPPQSSAKPEPSSPEPQDKPKSAQHQAGGDRREQTKSPADSRSGGDQATGNRISGKQYKYIMDLLKEARMTKRQLNAYCLETYGSVVDHISRSDASSLIDWLLNQ